MRTTTAAQRAAIFLDRDGTLIEEGALISRPEQVRLLPGAAQSLERIRAAGYLAIVVTNQSAIARGQLEVSGLERIHDALRRQLADEGTRVDGIYFAPDAPDPQAEAADPRAWRKPGAGMLLRAAEDHGLALARCWMVGDQLRDIEAGRRAGCRGSLLVRTGAAALPEGDQRKADASFDDLGAAVDFILAAG